MLFHIRTPATSGLLIKPWPWPSLHWPGHCQFKDWTTEKWDNSHTGPTPSLFIYFYFFKCFKKVFISIYLRISTCQLSKKFFSHCLWKAKKFCRFEYSWISSTRNIILWKRIYTFHSFFLSVLNCKKWKIESYATIRSTNVPMLAMLYDGFSEL